jgi:hypothetical protein
MAERRGRGKGGAVYGKAEPGRALPHGGAAETRGTVEQFTVRALPYGSGGAAETPSLTVRVLPVLGYSRVVSNCMVA